MLTILRHVDVIFFKRDHPEPKIGNATKSNTKWVHIEFALQEWMHAKYNKILLNLV
jgi:hypothetical protein